MPCIQPSGDPEFHLVRECVRLWYSPAYEPRFDTCLDFERVRRMASEHGVAPLVLESLRTHCWEAIPPDVRSRFESSERTHVGRTMGQVGTLVELLRASEQAGIRVVPFKGPVLTMGLYGRLKARESSDLDLVIRAGDLPRMRALLFERGYESRERIPDRQLSSFLDYECEQGFVHRRREALVEVHWGFAQRYFGFDLTPDVLWNRLVPIKLFGIDILTFRPEDQVLLLAIHGTRHLWAALKWICDIAACVSAWPGLDWISALSEARRVNSERPLLIALELANWLTGISLPDLVSARIQSDPAVRRIAASIRRRLEKSKRPDIFDILLLHIGRREGIRAQLRQAAMLAFLPTAVDWERPAPTPLLALSRPLRLVKKYVRLPLS